VVGRIIAYQPAKREGFLMKYLLVIAVLAATACTPMRMAGQAVVTTGQVALGAADLVL